MFEKSWVAVFRLDWNEHHLENFLKTAKPDKFSKNSWKWWPGMWIFEKLQWNSNARVENHHLRFGEVFYNIVLAWGIDLQLPWHHEMWLEKKKSSD